MSMSDAEQLVQQIADTRCADEKHIIWVCMLCEHSFFWADWSKSSSIPAGVDLRMKAGARAKLLFCTCVCSLALVVCVHKHI